MNPIATAKQTVSLLSLAGLVWVISHLPKIPATGLYADLRYPVLAVLVSASLYLLLVGIQAFTHQPGDAPPVRREMGWAMVHAVVLFTVGASLLRGPRSFALLVGLDGLISVVAAVSAVSLFVYGYSAWIASQGEPAAATSPAGGGPAHKWLTHVLQLVACLPLVLSVAYLELFPTEQAEQVQFQVGSEI